MPRFGFCGATYTSESPNVAAQRCINWYPEKVDDTVTPIAMYPTAGITPFANITGSAVRGLYSFNGRVFGVGSNFSEILSDGTVVGYSFLPVDSNPVSMAANNANQLIICSGGELWLFPLAGGTIIYTPTTDTVTTIQIVDNADPAVKDYYVTVSSPPLQTVGTSMTLASISPLTFLNGQVAPIVDIVGSIIHLQLPRTLTSSYTQIISSIAMAQGSTQNSINGAGFGGSYSTSIANNASGTSTYKTSSKYGFNIPTGATILGFAISFDRYVSNTNLQINTNNAIMYKAGVAVGTSAGPGSTWSTTPSTESYGSSSDLWGTTWTPADVNDILFGFAVQFDFDNSGPGSYFYHLINYTITCYYALQDATITLSSTCLFTTAGQPVTMGGLTHATGLNGVTAAVVSPSGSTLVVQNVPGPLYTGAETGTVTGELINYGPTSNTGNITGNVITYTSNPIQVAIGQGPFASVDFVDGYFLALIANSQKFQISDLEDGTTWNPINTFQVNQYADNITSMIVDHREVWFFGPKRTLVYYDSGDALIPFQPISGAFIEQGIAAQWSVVRLDNSIMWLGEDERGWGVAWRANGYTPVRISNHAVENTWRTYGDISDAIAFSFQENGHAFWQIWFPSANATWVYDAATNQWHERSWYNAGAAQAHLARCHCFGFNQHLVGDRQSGTIYTQSIDLVSDTVSGVAGEIQRIRRAPHIGSEKQWVYYQQLQVDLQTGMGNTGYGPTITSFSLTQPDHTCVQYGVDNSGTLVAITSVIAAENVILFQDSVVQTDFYQLINDTSSVLHVVAISMPQNFIQQLAMQSPDGNVWNVTVQSGSIVVTQVTTAPAQISLRWSDDSCQTWSNYYQLSAGALGEYKKRVIWRRLGRSRDRVFEISCSDPVSWRIVDAYLQVNNGV